ncbi:hypothetical protein NPX13_g8302 [Xylaria arbuscula]|uniref:Heterokaryon incompatibility domain-containing protein n=1 Tax=Xylaria arbuscula TaxID=114810 RepID=A0A9W8TIQ6_9PEZI|nr:hypothetical protein NPX13_g8302 [Xylaria arbuscula]
MRLIHIPTFTLIETEPSRPPPSYVILSHTWSTNSKDEVSFHAFENFVAMRDKPQKIAKDYINYLFKGYQTKSPGLGKILGACNAALAYGLEYLWVDTCCIDKSNHTEMAESINSMFAWYENAAICLAYISDYWLQQMGFDQSSLSQCRWFWRAWTLQELLAPQYVYFFDAAWTPFGEKRHLAPLLSAIIGIEMCYLTRQVSLRQASVAKRMSWASRRQTSKEEDLAYCLLGIFGVSMPLLYGERSNAFIRLQEEILKESDDHSLFAWVQNPLSRQKSDPNCGDPNCRDANCDSSVCSNQRCNRPTCMITPSIPNRQVRGLLATSPGDFAVSGGITSYARAKATHGYITMTNRGVYMPAMLSYEAHQHNSREILVPVLKLNCSLDDPNPIAIYLHKESGDQYTRAWPSLLTRCSRRGKEGIYVLKTLSTFRSAAGHSLDQAVFLAITASPYVAEWNMPPMWFTPEGERYLPTLVWHQDSKPQK